MKSMENLSIRSRICDSISKVKSSYLGGFSSPDYRQLGLGLYASGLPEVRETFEKMLKDLIAGDKALKPAIGREFGRYVWTDSDGELCLFVYHRALPDCNLVLKTRTNPFDQFDVPTVIGSKFVTTIGGHKLSKLPGHGFQLKEMKGFRQLRDNASVGRKNGFEDRALAFREYLAYKLSIEANRLEDGELRKKMLCACAFISGKSFKEVSMKKGSELATAVCGVNLPLPTVIAHNAYKRILDDGMLLDAKKKAYEDYERGIAKLKQQLKRTERRLLKRMKKKAEAKARKVAEQVCIDENAKRAFLAHFNELVGVEEGIYDFTMPKLGNFEAFC